MFLNLLRRILARHSKDQVGTVHASAARLRSGPLDLFGWGLQILPLVALLAASVTTGPAYRLLRFRLANLAPPAISGHSARN
jgi:hypothetical protein